MSFLIVPSELGALSSLEKLFLHGNQLSSTLPTELGQWSALTYANLEKNLFTGM